jgi:hypothetical protein
MMKARTKTVRATNDARSEPGAPLKRLPRTTKDMHGRLLRALDDRRLRRTFSSR